MKIVSIRTHQITHIHFGFTTPKGLTIPPSDEKHREKLGARKRR